MGTHVGHFVQLTYPLNRAQGPHGFETHLTQAFTTGVGMASDRVPAAITPKTAAFNSFFIVDPLFRTLALP
jgi:hypothetical protein